MRRRGWWKALAVAGALLGAPVSPAQITPELMGQLQELTDRGMQLYAEGKYAEAAAQLEKAVRLCPPGMNNPTLEYNLACVDALSGRKKEALTHLDKAITAGFTDVRHIEADADLVSLRGDPKYVASVARAAQRAEEARKNLDRIPAPQSIFHRPKGVPEGQKTPLLVFLHGAGGAPKQMEPVLLPVAESMKFSLLLPCGGVKIGVRANGTPAYTYTSLDMDTIVREIKARQDILEDQVYIGGFSAGGKMAYFAALSRPEIFAGAMAFSGALQPDMLTEATQHPPSRKIPIFIVHGTSDQFAAARHAEKYFQDNGHRVALRSFEGGHMLPPNGAQRIQEAIQFFRAGPEAKPAVGGDQANTPPDERTQTTDAARAGMK